MSSRRTGRNFEADFGVVYGHSGDVLDLRHDTLPNDFWFLNFEDKIPS